MTKKIEPVHPAIFIGLGTTGKNIIEYVEQFVREQYGIILEREQIASLPIFEFLVFETDSGNKPKIPLAGRTKIQNHWLTINNVRAVGQNLNTAYNYLNQWIDKEVFNHAEQELLAGAKNIRMIGRLCLWEKENWTKITNAIRLALQSVTSNNNGNKTEEILRRYYESIGISLGPQDILVDNAPQVHIVGTLCGGTCSGTFLDVAFFIRSLVQVSKGDLTGGSSIPAPIIQGWFTVQDIATALAAYNSEDWEKQAGNCWAALIELEYYMNSQTTYRYQFPGQTGIFDTRNWPFDQVYLVSPSGNYANLRESSGENDIGALNHMIALALYSETVAELLAAKQGIRTNVDISRIHTFGIASAWFSKYQIAEAAASKRGSDVCEYWLRRITLDESKQKGDPKTNAKKAWKRIYKEISKELTRQASGTYIEDEITNWFSGHRDDLLGLEPDDLCAELRPRLEELLPGKRWDRECLSDRRLHEDIREKFCKALSDTIYGAINDYKRIETSIDFVDTLLNEKLKAAIEQNVVYPNAGEYDFTGLKAKLKPDIWSRLLFMHSVVEKDRKQFCLKEFKFELERYLEQARTYYVREILKPLRSETADCWASQVNKELAGMKIFLTGLRDNLDKRYREIKSNLPWVPQNQKMIFQAGSTIEKAVDTLYKRLPEPQTLDGLDMEEKVLGGNSFYEFLKKGISEIDQQLVGMWRAEALELVNGFNIADALLQRYSKNLESLSNWACYSNPMLEIGGELPTVVFPGFLIGNDDEKKQSLTSLISALREHPQKQFTLGDIQIRASRALDHLLILYQEQPGIEMQKNLRTKTTFLTYYNRHLDIIKEVKEGRLKLDKDKSLLHFMRHTHKDGPEAFDLSKLQRINRAPELLKLAYDVLSWRDSDGKWQSVVFEVKKDELALIMKRSDDREFPMGNDKEVDLQILIKEPEIFEQFEKHISSCVQEKGGWKDCCMKRLNDYRVRFKQELAKRHKLTASEEARKVSEELEIIERLFGTLGVRKGEEGEG